MQPKDTNSLAHTKWNCKYHIVFAAKYRRKIFYGENKAEIGKIPRELCDWKRVKIVEAEVYSSKIICRKIGSSSKSRLYESAAG